MIGMWAFIKFGLPIGLLLLVGAYGTGYFKGKWAAERACDRASLLAEIAKLEQEKATEAAAEAEEDKAKTELETENADLEKRVSDYADELAKRPDRCAVNDSDLERMQ
jgi:hypothetical protein